MSEKIRQLPVMVTGVWTRRMGDKVETLLEIYGHWVLVSTECYDGRFSHIVEPNGIRRAYTQQFLGAET